MEPRRAPDFEFSAYARSHGALFFSGDGNDVQEVWRVTGQALEAMREGAPQLHEPDVTHPNAGKHHGDIYDAALDPTLWTRALDRSCSFVGGSSALLHWRDVASESSAALRSSQCFYLAAEFSKSVSLSVTTVPSGNSNKAAARDFWKQTFARNQEREKERETEREGDKEKKESLREQQRGKGEEEGGAPLRKIEGIGEEAYWSGTRVGGALYVLKGNAFIRISLGGADTDEVRIEKSKKLAAKAIERL